MIPFNKPYMTGKELWNIAQAHARGHLSGDGAVHEAVQCSGSRSASGTGKALLTHSCTAALEMAALLADVEPGDEVIMPSYTFVSTANAFVLRGARAGVRRHPAGHAQHRRDGASRRRSPPRTTRDRAGPLRRRRLRDGRDHGDRRQAHSCCVIEDAAQGLLATYRGRPLGSIGDLAALSLPRDQERHLRRGRRAAGQRSALRRARRDHPREGHEPQPVLPRPGRQVHVGRRRLVLPARRDHRGVPLGADGGGRARSRRRRMAIWNTYHQWFAEPERAGKLRRPIVPAHCGHNAHMYYILLPDLDRRSAVIERLEDTPGCKASSTTSRCTAHPAGRKYGRAHGEMTVPTTPPIACCDCRNGSASRSSRSRSSRPSCRCSDGHRSQERRSRGHGPHSLWRQPVLRRQPHVRGEGARAGDAPSRTGAPSSRCSMPRTRRAFAPSCARRTTAWPRSATTSVPTPTNTRTIASTRACRTRTSTRMP